MFLAVDVESTGLSDKCNVLTAYFIILDKDLNEISTLSLEIKHDHYNIQPRAMEINKIDLTEHEKTAINVDEAMVELEKFLQTHKTGDKFTSLGHNIKYDIKMLRSNKILTDSILDNYILSDFVDTIDLGKYLKSKNKIPSSQSLSLSKICNFLEIKTNCDLLHTAEYDIRLTIELYKHMLQMV
jgi:DNA polymerase III epsilon subunit-like protein